MGTTGSCGTNNECMTGMCSEGNCETTETDCSSVIEVGNEDCNVAACDAETGCFAEPINEGTSQL